MPAFLSYSRDVELAERVRGSSAMRGVTVWRDQEQLYGGQRWPKALGEAIARRARAAVSRQRQIGVRRAGMVHCAGSEKGGPSLPLMAAPVFPLPAHFLSLR